MTPLLDLRNVSKVYGGGGLFRTHEATYALRNLSYSIPQDEASMTAIAGESGSGKTTMAMLMLGFLSPTSGQVLYRGKDVATMSSAERRQFRREVQPIFQDPFEAFNPFYRVDHVLERPLKRFGLASSRREARRMMEEALERVGLRPTETLGRFPHQLSGGQRQRIGIARALLCHPRVIVADEPVSMVDASLRATILASLQALNRDFGISILYITHDLTTAYQICQNIVVLYLGTVAEVGTVERVAQSGDALLVDIRVGREVEETTVLHGAITVDGVSLTVNSLPSAGVVQVSLVPFTREHTTLGRVAQGDRVHIEADVLGKYVRQLCRSAQ